MAANTPTNQNGAGPSSTPTNNPILSQTNVTMISNLFNSIKLPNGQNPNIDERVVRLMLERMPGLQPLLNDEKNRENVVAALRDHLMKTTAAGTASGGSGYAPSPSTTAATLMTPKVEPTATALKSGGATPMLGSESNNGFPISQTLNTTNPGPVTWAASQQGRPTLSGGNIGGRIAGTPAQVARASDDSSMLSLDDSKTRRKNSAGDQVMRRSMQDLVSSIDPNVKVDSEVEDLLLDIADEFIDSVTNFACRLAKHRGGDALEVRDLQLHLERNHNIRIPGFASDETRISQSGVAAPTAGGTGGKTKANGAVQMTLRSHRLQQVAQAKRDSKLV